jgi:glycosyltransferase involved in cell wall biosynthesis
MDNAVSQIFDSIDVIIPVYNGEYTIVKAIESVMAQTNVIIGKIIVVNDGSTDATASVIGSMNLTNLELITTLNQGVAVARNTGIAVADSEWIAFLDADDCWLKDKLEKQLAIAKQQGVSFVCSAINPFCNKSEQKISFLSLWKGNFIATSSVLMTRELTREINPLFRSGMTFAEDYATWFKILTTCTGYFTAEVLTQYVVSPKPNYRLGSIFWNFMILQKECMLFLLRTKIPIHKKIAGLVILVSGTSLSILSIFKRFLSAYLQSNHSLRDSDV